MTIWIPHLIFFKTVSEFSKSCILPSEVREKLLKSNHNIDSDFLVMKETVHFRSLFKIHYFNIV